jgi:hypothetical protein
LTKLSEVRARHLVILGLLTLGTVLIAWFLPCAFPPAVGAAQAVGQSRVLAHFNAETRAIRLRQRQWC